MRWRLYGEKDKYDEKPKTKRFEYHKVENEYEGFGGLKDWIEEVSEDYNQRAKGYNKDKNNNINKKYNSTTNRQKDVFLTKDERYKATKKKIIATLLATFLGIFGAHKFYLGKPKLGIFYLLFCWTLVPGGIGILEALIYISTNVDDFARKYGIE